MKSKKKRPAFLFRFPFFTMKKLQLTFPAGLHKIEYKKWIQKLLSFWKTTISYEKKVRSASS